MILTRRAALAADAGTVSARTQGVRGDGRALDHGAINRLIADLSRGGGTVHLPAGRYLCFSIRLRNTVTLELGPGAVIVAADPATDGGSYDAPEVHPHDFFQDFGNSHWQNSLIRADRAAARDVPEERSAYPDPSMFGTLPARGLYVRHARRVRIDGLRVSTEVPDVRPPLVFDDARDARQRSRALAPAGSRRARLDVPPRAGRGAGRTIVRASQDRRAGSIGAGGAAAERRSDAQLAQVSAAVTVLAEHSLRSEAGRQADYQFHAALLKAVLDLIERGFRDTARAVHLAREAPEDGGQR